LLGNWRFSVLAGGIRRIWQNHLALVVDTLRNTVLVLSTRFVLDSPVQRQQARAE
jgi:hypothetical protein